jgi:hypothetical protein
MGGIVYKLNNLKGGNSTTDLDVKSESSRQAKWRRPPGSMRKLER